VRLLDRSAEKNPDDADALIAGTFARLEVGRMKDAVTLARRAVQIRPFSPRAQEALIAALTYFGQFDAARQELAKSDALFPGASNLKAMHFSLDLRYGSPAAALKQLQQGEIPGFPAQETLLEARMDPAPAKVASAIASARRTIDKDSPGTVANYLQVLAQFGRTDEIFDFLLNWPEPKRLGFIGVLFRPAFHDFWRDPRAMRVAANFGLVRYWKSTGTWPDLCFEPDLPYDCRTEAAKFIMQ
jgi:tetratricopeptide (TPR) repeat protein